MNEREQFEEWAKAEGRLNLIKRGDRYFWGDTARAWKIWQARAALPAPGTPHLFAYFPCKVNGIDVGPKGFELIPVPGHDYTIELAWQTMDTAPRDGTEILVSDGTDMWVSRCSDGTNWFCGEFNMPPDFWMPLPMPPKETP